MQPYIARLSEEVNIESVLQGTRRYNPYTHPFNATVHFVADRLTDDMPIQSVQSAEIVLSASLREITCVVLMSLPVNVTEAPRAYSANAAAAECYYDVMSDWTAPALLHR